jgi:heme/copper-type cytochrome/quinol oxidase subunit 2
MKKHKQRCTCWAKGLAHTELKNSNPSLSSFSTNDISFLVVVMVVVMVVVVMMVAVVVVMVVSMVEKRRREIGGNRF